MKKKKKERKERKTKIITSGPKSLCRLDGEKMDTVRHFIFWGSKIAAYGDCTHEIKRCLLLGRNVMINLDIILKGRDITLPTKVNLVKSMVFPVVMYRCAAAAAAKLLQSCPTLWDPIDGIPPGSTVPGIFQARTWECFAVAFSGMDVRVRL